MASVSGELETALRASIDASRVNGQVLEPGAAAPPRVEVAAPSALAFQRCRAEHRWQASGFGSPKRCRRGTGSRGKTRNCVFSLGPKSKASGHAANSESVVKAGFHSRLSRSSSVWLALPERLKGGRSCRYYLVLSEQNGACVVNARRTLQHRMSGGYPLAKPELQRRIKVMKHLLSGVAIVAALAFAAPVWAQRTGPGVGAPGPNQPVPGGPGPSSPSSNLPPTYGTQYPATDLPRTAPPATMAPGTMAPGATTSAMPPEHRHARVSTHHHGLRAHPPSQMAGTTANQLNQEELARLQSGNFANPPAPPGPEPSASNPAIGPGRAARRARNQ